MVTMSSHSSISREIFSYANALVGELRVIEEGSSSFIEMLILVG